MPALTHLDEPANGVIETPAAAVRGWVADDGPEPITAAELVNADGLVVPLALVERPDVREAVPNLTASGFSGWIDARAARASPWFLRYTREGAAYDLPLPLRADERMAAAFDAAKRAKLAMVRPLLRCPLCRAALVDESGALRCTNGDVFPADGDDAYDLLTPAMRRDVRADATDNVSAHGYDDVLTSLIATSPGPVADVGAGLRPDYRPDVINVEIVRYPTTDVVAAAEFLPFADATFDVVISVAVLEHVRDPFAAARELQRILRPGGRIFAAVPFLQPYHGYPHHYYNMTEAGLLNLFPDVQPESISVPAAGHPIFALSWMLRAWREALPPETAERFAAMRVDELTGDPVASFGQPYVDQLPERTRRDLAALNVLIGRKRLA